MAATSCVPAPAPPASVTAAARIADPATLLRGLDLDVGAAGSLTKPLSGHVVGLPHAAPAFRFAARTEEDAARARECLTAAVYYEARSESQEGQRAVAQVVLNRVRDRAFPASVCGVVYQGAQRRTGCQFSFTCDGSLWRPREPAAWERARRVAEAALAGEVYAPVGAATFYHASYVTPWWAPSMTRVTAIGSHLFYRWRGAMERALSFRQAYAAVEPDTPTPARPRDPVADPLSSDGTRYAFAGGAVTVHRSSGGDAEPVRRTLLASGVRIHRGLTPVEAVAPASGASIGEEDGQT